MSYKNYSSKDFSEQYMDLRQLINVSECLKSTYSELFKLQLNLWQIQRKKEDNETKLHDSIVCHNMGLTLPLGKEALYSLKKANIVPKTIRTDFDITFFADLLLKPRYQTQGTKNTVIQCKESLINLIVLWQAMLITALLAPTTFTQHSLKTLNETK